MLYFFCKYLLIEGQHEELFSLGLFLSLGMLWKWHVGPLTQAEPLIAGAIIGAIDGASLGLTLKNWRGVGFLALAGAIGFSVPMQATESPFGGLSL